MRVVSLFHKIKKFTSQGTGTLENYGNTAGPIVENRKPALSHAGRWCVSSMSASTNVCSGGSVLTAPSCGCT